MDKFTTNELKTLILYKFEEPKKRKYTRKVKEPVKKPIKEYIEPNYNKEYEEQPENLDDFHLNFGLNYIEPKEKLQPKKREEENDWFDIGAGHSSVQSVLIPKNKFTKIQAIEYIMEHFELIKMDETPNYYRFRQHKPNKTSHYVSKKIKNGIILIIEYNDDMGGSLPVDIIYKAIKNGYSHAHDKPDEIIDVGDDYVFDKNDSSNEVQVYINFKEERIIINFVGTYKLYDWGNNYKYVTGRYRNTRRFQHAKSIVEKVINLYPHYKISLVGHSQSAVITREIGKDFGDKIFEIINLNGANLREKALPNEYNIRSKIDVVSLLTKNNDRVITIPQQGFSILKEHSPEILKRLNPLHEIGV
jgi:hypothetical protein